MNIELRHLRYFVAVAEELHFGRAAARLNISQPPLSQQIQILEQQVGARLLARTNRSVALTAAGRQFLVDSRHILSLVNDAAARAERLHQGEAGEIRIGFTSSAPFIRVDAVINIGAGIDFQQFNTGKLQQFGSGGGNEFFNMFLRHQTL
ncbi:LysR family transcriptional regulator, partial [Salmonella enterica subsp. enterica serovar Montevideo]|nr:LysR family transcriptional regulator [Salmonella enterica subsp. enterica serovar Montevideo]